MAGGTDTCPHIARSPLGAAIHLLGELREAIDKGELTLAYQPKFDLRTAAIVGVEALVRWPQRKRRLLSPDELGNMEGTREVLNQLRRNGIRIAIDDFGTGYSTLSYLCDLPVDEVKLDRDFILPVVLNARVATVVRTVVELAHELGLTTVAEGVEDAEIAERLADYGCDVVQGFHFSPPVSSEEVLRLAGLPRAARPAGAPARR